MSKTTIFFPDLSNYQAGLVLEPATVAVIAKATQGTSSVDASYASFKEQAAAQKSIFSGYHFLEAGNGAAQAQHYFNTAGKTPCMIDCEQNGTSNPTVQDCLDFWNALKSLGGRVWGVYFPSWYWADIKKPSLTPLAGLALVASDYNVYSDTSSGWNVYGGMAPSVLQYSDAFEYNGKQIDFNAYRGTTAQFAALVNGPAAVSDTPTPPVADTPTITPGSEETDMFTTSVNGRAGLAWAAGSKHVVEVNYDPAGGNPTLRVVLPLTTGPLVSAQWTLANGTGTLEIPVDYIANCRGVILEAQGKSPVFDICAV